MTHNEAIVSLLEACENLKEAIEQLQEDYVGGDVLCSKAQNKLKF